MDIHVPEEHVESDCFPADSRQHALDGTGALLKSARPWTCCKVAAQRVEGFVTTITSRLVDRQRERQPLQQDHAEQVGRHSVLRCNRGVRQHNACVEAGVRTQVGAERSSTASQHQDPPEVGVSNVGCPILPTVWHSPGSRALC